MYSAVDIAFYFILKSKEESKPISNLKLQKLVYLAHGLYIANHNQSLLNEKIECWPYGPVISVLYHKFKMYGMTDIPLAAVTHDLPEFKPEVKEALDFTWKITKNVDAIQLSNWTHKLDSPWTYASENNLSEVPNDKIKEYFSQFAYTPSH